MLYQGVTAFYQACNMKHADVMVCLVTHGADPSVTDNSGTSPFSLIDKELFGKIFIILTDFFLNPKTNADQFSKGDFTQFTTQGSFDSYLYSKIR